MIGSFVIITLTSCISLGASHSVDVSCWSKLHQCYRVLRILLKLYSVVHKISNVVQM